MLKPSALGYVVPTRVIGNVLWSELENDDDTKIVCPATVNNLEQYSDHCLVEISADNTTRCVKSRLVVLADGGQSSLTREFNNLSENGTGDTSQSTQYPQSAILSIVTTDRPHNGRAYERFTDEGPLALLPHRVDGDKAGYALVWTTSMDNSRSTYGLYPTMISWLICSSHSEIEQETSAIRPLVNATRSEGRHYRSLPGAE